MVEHIRSIGRNEEIIAATAAKVRQESGKRMAELETEQRGHERELKRLHTRVQKLVSESFTAVSNGGAAMDQLAWLFTRLLILSEERGPHATGAAWLDIDGCQRLFKRPVTAERFVTDKAFAELLASLDNRITLLLGHTRWRTRGDERVNSNNHPIRAGEVIGTHNGTIYNADYLFRRWKLCRFAEVDSEILFRLAANAARDGAMDIERFKTRLRRCRGQITAVIACRTDPGTVLVLKGNRPLELRWHPRRKAVLYASDPVYGELLTFNDPETRLPAIDRLEGFHPGGPCLCRRVLVPVQVNRGILPTWLYVVDATGHRGSKPLPSGRWRS